MFVAAVGRIIVSSESRTDRKVMCASVGGRFASMGSSGAGPGGVSITLGGPEGSGWALAKNKRGPGRVLSRGVSRCPQRGPARF